MAALADLRVSVTKASPVEDHSTYQYHIQLHCGTASWEVAKRFSDFDKLLQSLANGKYAGLPKLPSKTLLGSPTDQAAIDARKEQLRIILFDLLFRPDTRTSQQLRQFLALDSHTETAIKSLQPDALRTFEDPRFGVSGLCAVPHANLLLVTHEDSTHLSRLGRVWSVVEPDELGALHVWAKAGTGNDGSWKRVYSSTFGIKARSLCWEETTRQFFVGLEDGRIEVYFVPEESPTPSLTATLELHHKSPVTHLSASPRWLLSLGFDTAMRTIDVKTRELVCGGRLLKRLRSEADYLTSGYLDDVNGRAFVGTSCGDIFVLDISRNPPNFLHTLELGSTITAMCILPDHAARTFGHSGSDVFSLPSPPQRFLVAHGDNISVLSFEGKGLEKRMRRLGAHKSKHLQEGEVTILCMAVAPERQLVFGGYSDGSLAIWSARESEAFVVLRAHQCSTSQVAWLGAGDAPWGPALLTGGGDGKVTTWSLASSQDLEAWASFWSPEIGATGSADVFGTIGAAGGLGSTSGGMGELDPSLAAFEPTWGSGTDIFRAVDNPRVNPQALKNAEDSESDDGLADAFH